MEQIGMNFGVNPEQIGSIFGWKSITAWILLFGFGLFYKWLVYEYLPEVKRVKNRTAELVVAGVLVTLLGHGFVVGWNTVVLGWEAILNVLLCFVFSGVPMVIGYWNKDADENSKKEQRAAEDEKRAKERIKKASQIVSKE